MRQGNRRVKPGQVIRRVGGAGCRKAIVVWDNRLNGMRAKTCKGSVVKPCNTLNMTAWSSDYLNRRLSTGVQYNCAAALGDTC